MKRDIIVKREFNVGPDGTLGHGRRRGATNVSLNFFRPTPQPRSTYECAYEIRKDDQVIRRFVTYGIDGINALMSAMRLVVADVKRGILGRLGASIPDEYFEDISTDTKERDFPIPLLGPDAVELPRWISPRAQIVIEERHDTSIVGEARLGPRPVARLVWTVYGELVHAKQLDAEGKGHGFEIEWDAGKTTWFTQWVHGKQHGLAIQLDGRGRPLLATRFVRGRGTDLWTYCGQVSELREKVEGRLHGLVRWGDPEQPWEEEHYNRGQRHGIFRRWDDGTLQKGFPQFYLHDRQISRRAYLVAQARDPSLPHYAERDDRNHRSLPPVVREAIARARQLRQDRVLLQRMRRLGAVRRRAPAHDTRQVK